jgi:hypothetical protein
MQQAKRPRIASWQSSLRAFREGFVVQFCFTAAVAFWASAVACRKRWACGAKRSTSCAPRATVCI